MANILHSAIAYRSDFLTREVWAGARREPIPVACPGGCAVEYELFVPEASSGEDALKWVEALLEHLEADHPRHDSMIKL